MLLLALHLAHAEEGMWLPSDLPQVADRLRQAGIDLDVQALASDPTAAPLGAVVSLGGCTGAVVSPRGLVATNHHCVSSCLRYNAAERPDLPRTGHLAAGREQELSCGPAARLRRVLSITDVSERVWAAGGGLQADRADLDAMEQARKDLVAACEARPHRRCAVRSTDEGLRWLLVEQEEFEDLRLVWAPPSGIGDFGGEIDNWMWPRHAGDIALLRVYVGADGQPAAFSPDNVPWRPAVHLAASTEGLAEGDPVVVAGFPGHTERHRLAVELAQQVEREIPWRIALGREMLELLEGLAAEDEQAAARLTAPIGWIANGVKYREALLAALQRGDPVADRRAFEASLAQADPAAAAALAELEPLVEEASAHWERDRLVDLLVGWVDLVGVAHRALRFAEEEARPDPEREPGYQARDRGPYLDRLRQLDRTLWVPADRELARLLLRRLHALPEGERVPPVEQAIARAGGVDALVAELFPEHPPLADLDRRLAWMDADVPAFHTATDPLVRFAVALEDGFLDARRSARRDLEARMLPRRARMAAARRAATPGPDYADANGTLRLTWGHVRGVDGGPAFTTVEGVARKAGDPPFDAPDWLLDAIGTAPASRWADPALGTVPVDFLSTVDTTGGNSGSPTLDAQGRWVGQLFDGTWDSVGADQVWDDERVRSIHVDLRYVLWLLELQPDAAWILAEVLGGTP